MAEIKEVKTEKITVNTGERIKISFEFWYEQDCPYDYPQDYPIDLPKRLPNSKQKKVRNY